MIYFIATRAPLAIEVKQKFLEDANIADHVKELTDYLLRQSEEQKVEQGLHESVKRQMEKNQREYFLNEK